MTQVFDEQKLTSVGDFMLSANDNKTTVEIVTGHTYEPLISTNSYPSNSSLNNIGLRSAPRVQEFPLETAISSLDTLTEHYKELTARLTEMTNKTSNSSWLSVDVINATLDIINRDVLSKLDASKKEIGKLQLN